MFVHKLELKKNAFFVGKTILFFSCKQTNKKPEKTKKLKKWSWGEFKGVDSFSCFF